MSVVIADRLSGGPLRDVGFSLEPGRHALLASPQETSWLVGVLSGTVRPRRGSVRIDGGDPHRDPRLRRRIGCLLESEPPLTGRTVRTALASSLGNARAIESALGSLGLGAWVDRSPARLTTAEQRSIALATALALPEPTLVVLWEPFAGTTGVSRESLLDRLATVSERGCLVCATSSVRDALALDGTVMVLNRGSVVSRSLAFATELAPGNVNDYVVRTERARDLAAALMKRSEVVGVNWDGRAAPRTLHVRGRDGEQTARAIIETARAAQIPVESMVAEDPSLQLVQSAGQGALRAAYEQGYRTAVPAPATAPARAPAAGGLPIAATSAPKLELPSASNLPGTAPAPVALADVTAPTASLGGAPAPTAKLDDVTSPPAAWSAIDAPNPPAEPDRVDPDDEEEAP